MIAMQPSAPTGAARGRIRLARPGLKVARAIRSQIADSPTLRFWARQLDPTWSVTTTRARVVDVIVETHDVSTFVLEPSARWRGHRAGQFAPVDVEVDGVRATRCYSISSAPGDELVHITVKRVPNGRVSSWMHDRVRRGEILTLGEPAGDLCFEPSPGAASSKLLLLSGGSGVTPLMSILRQLARRDALCDVVFVHAAQTKRDIVFERELSELASRHPGLHLVFVVEDDPIRGGRIDGAKLMAMVPDLAERETKLCGPSGMMDALSAFFRDIGLEHRLQTERFGSPRPLLATAAVTSVGPNVSLLRSGRTVSSSGDRSLLEELESAGERPASGCRMGICNTCLCRKRSGVTEDMTTGALSDEADQDIRLCVSRARTDVELAL